MNGYITTKQAAEHFNVSWTTAQNWCKSGRITCKKGPDGKWLVKKNQKSPERVEKQNTCDAPIAGYYAPGRFLGDQNQTKV